MSFKFKCVKILVLWYQVTALDDQPPPIIAIGPANQTLPVNTIAVLPCQASGNPKPAIRWLKGGRPLGTADHTSRIMVEPSGTLVIDSKLHFTNGSTVWSMWLLNRLC